VESLQHPTRKEQILNLEILLQLVKKIFFMAICHRSTRKDIITEADGKRFE